jgi:phosphate acetyltransferase
MVAKPLQYLARNEGAGLALGARVPIVPASRAETVRTNLASAATVMRAAEAHRVAGGGA